MPSLNFDRCRRLQHRWDELSGPPKDFEGYRRGANVIWLRCENCAMIKAFEISRYGEVLSPRYWPQPGYYWSDRTNPARDEPAPAKADYRLEWLREILKSRGQTLESVSVT